MHVSGFCWYWCSSSSFRVCRRGLSRVLCSSGIWLKFSSPAFLCVCSCSNRVFVSVLNFVLDPFGFIPHVFIKSVSGDSRGCLKALWFVFADVPYRVVVFVFSRMSRTSAPFCPCPMLGVVSSTCRVFGLWRSVFVFSRVCSCLAAVVAACV